MSEAVNTELPEGWERVPLKDAVHVILGQSPKSSTYNEDGKGLPFFQGKTEFGEIYPTVRKWCTEPKKVAEAEDILVSVRAPVGPTNLAPYECAIGRGLAALRPLGGSDPKYFLYLIRRYQDTLAALGTGTTFEAISGDTLKNFVVPVAPVEQQKRIVAKIEELFSHIDAGIEALKKAKQLLKQYRQSVLKAAVTGELTKEWREENKDKLEPASQLLERILKERRQKWEEQQHEHFKAKGKMPKDDKWKEKYKEPFDEHEESFELPLEWTWATVDQLGEVQLGRQRSPMNRSKDYPTKYIRAANITEEGLDFTDLLDMEFKPEEFERYVMKPNDLVLSEASGSPDQVGKPAIWKKDMPVCCFQNTVIRHRPHVVEPEYLLTHYKYFYWFRIFSKNASGVGINHLSAQKFLKMTVSFPPLLEQNEIVRRVHSNTEALKRLDAEINALLVKAEKNKQSVLASAFSGRFM